jgi:hypothetical protein
MIAIVRGCSEPLRTDPLPKFDDRRVIVTAKSLKSLVTPTGIEPVFQP